MPSPLDKQVGGSHYKGKGPQHVSFCQQNRIPWCEASAIKYLVRHRSKNGRQDAEKARHYVELLIHEDYTVGGRAPRGGQLPIDMNPIKFKVSLKDFLSLNGIGRPESRIINRLVHHQVDNGTKDLKECLELIDEILDTYDLPAEDLALL